MVVEESLRRPTALADSGRNRRFDACTLERMSAAGSGWMSAGTAAIGLEWNAPDAAGSRVEEGTRNAAKAVQVRVCAPCCLYMNAGWLRAALPI